MAPSVRGGRLDGLSGVRQLCRIDEIPEGGTRAFAPGAGGARGLFAVRRDGTVRVYVNSCPHLGVPLDWAPGRFLSANGGTIVCSMHGAEFRIADGECVSGPCHGERLEAVLAEIENGLLSVPEDAGV